MNKNQKDMKGNLKTATHSKAEFEKEKIKGDKSTGNRADDENDGAIKTFSKKVPVANTK